MQSLHTATLGLKARRFQLPFKRHWTGHRMAEGLTYSPNNSFTKRNGNRHKDRQPSGHKDP